MKVSSSANLFALHVPSAGAGIASAGKPAATGTDKTLAEQISAWQEARPSQSSLKSSPKLAAQEKAAMLKRRLEMLKSMLLFASPEAAKAIASQLKGIAGELAALGKSLGGGSAAPVTPSVALASGETTSAAVASEPAEMPAEPTDAADSEQAAAAVADDAAEPDNAENETPAGESAQKSDDSALRKAIADAKRLLKELILRTKAKLQEGDAQARRDLQAAEKSLADLDNMTGASLYSAVGGLDTAMAGAESSLALTGASVDVSA